MSEPPAAACRRTHTAQSQLSHRDNLLVGEVGTLSACFEPQVMISLTLSDLCLQGLNRRSTNRKCPWDTSVSVPVDCNQVNCSRFGFRPYSLGWEEGEEKAGTHLPDLINASQRGKRPRSSAFLWPAYTSCCPVHPVTGSPAPSTTAWPCPGYQALTPVSLFSHASFCHFVEEPVLFDFPRKELHFHFHLMHTLAHGWDGVNLFILLAHFCFLVQFIQVRVHRNQTALPRIHFCSQNCSPTTPPPLLCKFLSSLHLLQCCPQSSGSNHRCAHRSGFIRVHYLIFPILQLLESIFLHRLYLSK